MTIASTEWDANTRGWIPYKDAAHTGPSAACLDPRRLAMIQIADDYSLRLICMSGMLCSCQA
ncbi:MAG TPA: hypothetical protein VK817_22445 [Trebonia sp.]|jgi:hypothetical protein|nr:hypothetical protein [Trebonia sp.]